MQIFHQIIKRTFFGGIGYLLLFSSLARAHSVDYLSGCIGKEVPKRSMVLQLSFSESRERLYHSFEPWQTLKSSISGQFWGSGSIYVMFDTLHSKSGKLYPAKSEYGPARLLWCGFGDTTPGTITKSDWEDATIESAHYSPGVLLQYFYHHKNECRIREDSANTNYTLTIHKSSVTLEIRKKDSLLSSVRMLSSHELYGDVTDVFRYANYRNLRGLFVPFTIQIERMNGKVHGEVNIVSANISDTVPAAFPLQTLFRFSPQETEKKSEGTVQKFSDHIYFIDIQPADCRTMVVEFADFVLVAEAPLTSANGELILKEVNKLFPAKPIRYFAFGHFHPWYIGGVRPFIHRGITILTTNADIPYLHYIATAPRTLEPDSLALDPKPLHTEAIHDSMGISDNSYQMKIYVIGRKSHHTDDYLVYYFPKDKLLFEDDLTWIPLDKKISKANDRQAGLYHAVKDLGLAIDTVVQSWPLREYKVKSIFPFSDLEASMKSN